NNCVGGFALIPDSGLFSVDSQREALGTAASFDELIQLRGHSLVTPLLQVSRQSLAAGVEHDRLANHHGIAAEAKRLRFIDGDQPGNVSLQDLTSVGVEGGWVIDSFARGQGAEARIEMIKTGIDQLKG